MWSDIKPIVLRFADTVERVVDGYEQVDCVQVIGLHPQMVSFCEARVLASSERLARPSAAASAISLAMLPLKRRG